jgi:hypothetical protein
MEHAFGWADLDEQNRAHYQRRAASRSERATAENKVWALRQRIADHVEDNPSSNYHVTLRYQDILSILTAAAVTCRSDLSTASNLIAQASLITGRPHADIFSDDLRELANDISGAPESQSDEQMYNDLRAGG